MCSSAAHRTIRPPDQPVKRPAKPANLTQQLPLPNSAQKVEPPGELSITARTTTTITDDSQPDYTASDRRQRHTSSIKKYAHIYAFHEIEEPRRYTCLRQRRNAHIDCDFGWLEFIAYPAASAFIVVVGSKRSATPVLKKRGRSHRSRTGRS